MKTEVEVIQKRRGRREREDVYRKVRAAIAKYYNALVRQEKYSPLPPLEAFRQLDIIKAIQTPQTKNIEDRLKDPLVTDMLKMNLDRSVWLWELGSNCC